VVQVILAMCTAIFCMYRFYMVLTVDSNYSLNNINQLIYVMVKCSLWGTDWILKYYWGKLWLQRVKPQVWCWCQMLYACVVNHPKPVSTEWNKIPSSVTWFVFSFTIIVCVVCSLPHCTFPASQGSVCSEHEPLTSVCYWLFSQNLLWIF
jgi:hypothetical protein